MITSLKAPYPEIKIGPRVDADTHYAVSQFLFEEARLLDERRFEQWLELLADDVRYYMPLRHNRRRRDLAGEFSDTDSGAHFEDSKPMLATRVRRLNTGKAWSEDPPSRTRRLIGNVVAHHVIDSDDIQVDSNFYIYRGRHEHVVEQFAGTRRDVLRTVQSDCQWQISSRTILLDQTVILAANLGIFF